MCDVVETTKLTRRDLINTMQKKNVSMIFTTKKKL